MEPVTEVPSGDENDGVRRRGKMRPISERIIETQKAIEKKEQAIKTLRIRLDYLNARARRKADLLGVSVLEV